MYVCTCACACVFVFMHVLVHAAEISLTEEAVTGDCVLVSALLTDKRAPEFLQPLQITKTRAGMQVHNLASLPRQAQDSCFHVVVYSIKYVACTCKETKYQPITFSLIVSN